MQQFEDEVAIMFARWIKRAIAPRKPFAPVAPDVPFVALGDIHGRADLLDRALAQAPDCLIVCVGDYIDRGDHSAEVLRTLSARPDIICLSGNHEEMMLDFLAQPQKNGPRWLRYGGLQTLASFGIAGVSEGTTGAALDKAADALRSAMGPDLLHWLTTRPTLWQSGNVAVVHAAADPALPLDDQDPRTLHWGHADFDRVTREDDIWVLHGHTIVDAPTADAGRIAIDTGAYATGRLTMAHVSESGVNFSTA